jgi:probable F420-dependent oxidoreductase
VDEIKLGFALPQFGSLGQGGRVARFAAEAERLGAHSLWVGDRLLAAVDPAVGYGGRATIPAEFRTALDPFTVLTVAATATERVTLGFNVLNLPWYAPAVAARALTTIDVVSGGRLVPGFGIGWSPEEYAAAGVPWRGRGVRLDESLDALEALWTSSPARYRGSAVTVPESHVDLRPVQRPRPPIYLGGRSEAALRRIGRRADGWLPAGRLPGGLSADVLRAHRAVIREAAAEAGRADTDIHAILRVNVAAGTPLDAVVTALREVAAGTGIVDVLVDLMYLVSDVDEALEVAAWLLDAVRVG